LHPPTLLVFSLLVLSLSLRYMYLLGTSCLRLGLGLGLGTLALHTLRLQPSTYFQIRSTKF
jgi:hypothetical protein